MRDEVPGRRRDRRLQAAGEEIHKTNKLCVVLEVEIVLSASVYHRLQRENKSVETDLMGCRKRYLPGGRFSRELPDEVVPHGLFLSLFRRLDQNPSKRVRIIWCQSVGGL